MQVYHKTSWAFGLCLALGLGRVDFLFGQVSPAEVKNPSLKAAEETYFHQLEDLNRDIGKVTFPFPFVLRRYTGLEAKQPLGADSRGLEFVLFRDRVILKISGNYQAAFNPSRLTQNERADRVLGEVINPILRLIPQYFTPQAGFEGFGLEIAYHVRSQSRSFDYEGSEMLTVVFDKAAAFSYLNARTDSERQEILNATEIYVNGKEFGLALNAKDPFDLDTLARRQAPQPQPPPPKEPEKTLAGAAAGAAGGVELRRPDPDDHSFPGPHKPDPGQTLSSVAPPRATPNESPTSPAQTHADALQEKYGAQLAAFAKEGASRFHLVDYAPPFFAAFRKQVYLQITLRNPTSFDRNVTSIYKRSAQSFDLFLAPLLKPLLDNLPTGNDIAGLDITVLNELTPKGSPSSEAVEFISSLGSLRQFAEAEITSQDLINQSVVLVNGVRIAVDLQKVE
jgi:hypothetical protein